jgi:hypothetical protein
MAYNKKYSLPLFCLYAEQVMSLFFHSDRPGIVYARTWHLRHLVTKST